MSTFQQLSDTTFNNLNTKGAEQYAEIQKEEVLG